MNKDLFISTHSLKFLPSVPVYELLSDPAKSTNYILLVMTWSGSSFKKDSILRVKMQWLLEDATLRLWVAIILLLIPFAISLSTSYGLWHSYIYKFST